jgi:phosphatidylserine/phosphatidylglycerophosphate/cardiolipin synthase-like enzyme
MIELSKNNTSLISFKDYKILKRLILEQIHACKKHILIGTFNLQNIRLKLAGNYYSLSHILGGLIEKGVGIYILLQPRACRSTLIRELNNKYKNYKNLKIRSCGRVHLKTIILDLEIAYIGSANITGFGLGTRSISKKNFELGFITTEKNVISEVAHNFLDIFNGKYCNSNACFYFKNYKSKRQCDGII